MKLMNELVKMTLMPMIIHQQYDVIKMNLPCKALKLTDKLIEQGFDVWLNAFFQQDESLQALMVAISAEKPFRGILTTFSTGTKTKWQVQTLLLPLEQTKTSIQLTCLMDSAREDLLSAYWELHIKMNEATITLQDLIDKRTLALQQAEQAEKKTGFLASLVAINPLPVMRINKEKNIAYRNEPAVELMSAWTSLYSQPFPPELIIKLDNALNHKIPDMFEYEHKDKVFLLSITPIFLLAQYVDLFAIDVTALKKLERENEEKTVLLAHTGRLAALGEMATGVAHELNQPLSIIRTNIQTLEMLSKDQLSPEDISDILTSTQRQVERAAKIIAHMRSFAKEKSTKIGKIDITQSISNALSLFNEQFNLQGISTHCHFDADIPQLNLYAQQIEQIVVNLLSNAKYAVETMSEKEGKGFVMQITLNLKYDKVNKVVIFDVIDNGIGMSQSVVDRSLEPFFTTRAVGEGAGLGLSIVYNIVKMLHGQIKIVSLPNKGTTASIIFPVESE